VPGTKIPVQATWELTDDNRSRETSGLIAACRRIKTDNGLIVTFEGEGGFSRCNGHSPVFEAKKGSRFYA